VGVRFLTAVRAEVRYVDRFRTRGATGFEFDHDKGLMVCIHVDDLREGQGTDYWKNGQYVASGTRTSATARGCCTRPTAACA
jgi:hypothetical protein